MLDLRLFELLKPNYYLQLHRARGCQEAAGQRLRDGGPRQGGGQGDGRTASHLQQLGSFQ